MLAVPIGEVPALCLPSFPRGWANIAGMHRPPEMYVLVFREGAQSVGYCRLNPHFPGCFPFVLAEPSRRLVPALRSMKGYLRSEQPILKLTIWEPRLAEACRAAGLALNYELLKTRRAGERLGPPSAGA